MVVSSDDKANPAEMEHEKNIKTDPCDVYGIFTYHEWLIFYGKCTWILWDSEMVIYK